MILLLIFFAAFTKISSPTTCSQIPYKAMHIILLVNGKWGEKEGRNKCNLLFNHCAEKHRFENPVNFERKSNVIMLFEIPIGYRNSTPHKATPKIGKTLLFEQVWKPIESTLRLHFSK